MNSENAMKLQSAGLGQFITSSHWWVEVYLSVSVCQSLYSKCLSISQYLSVSPCISVSQTVLVPLCVLFTVSVCPNVSLSVLKFLFVSPSVF